MKLAAFVENALTGLGFAVPMTLAFLWLFWRVDEAGSPSSDRVSPQWLAAHEARLLQGDAPPTPDQIPRKLTVFEGREFRLIKGGYRGDEGDELFGGEVIREGVL